MAFWSFTCRSHYYIRKNDVRWVESWSDEMIRKNRNKQMEDLGHLREKNGIAINYSQWQQVFGMKYLPKTCLFFSILMIMEICISKGYWLIQFLTRSMPSKQVIIPTQTKYLHSRWTVHGHSYPWEEVTMDDARRIGTSDFACLSLFGGGPL